MSKHSAEKLQQKLAALGWVAREPGVWQDLVEQPPVVAFLAPPFDTVPSVQGNAIYVLIERLAAVCPLPCVVLARSIPSPMPLDSRLNKRLLYFDRELSPGLPEKLIPFHLRKRLWHTGAPHLLAYARSAGRVCTLLGVQHIVVEDMPAFSLAVRRQTSDSTRIILHQHIDAPLGLSTQSWKRITKAIDGIIFVAEQTRNVTEAKHGKLRIPNWVIYNGVDLRHYDPKHWERAASRLRAQLGISNADAVLLFVGRLTPHKGAAEAAEAFNLARVKHAHMVIVGDFNVTHNADPHYIARLRAAAAQSHGYIHLIGVVSQHDLPAYYAAADAVIIPSLGAEGLPKVATEALAMGRPILASERGGIAELIRDGHNGWLLHDAANNAQTAQTIRNILSNINELRSLQENIMCEYRESMSEQRMVDSFYRTINCDS